MKTPFDHIPFIPNTPTTSPTEPPKPPTPETLAEHLLTISETLTTQSLPGQTSPELDTLTAQLETWATETTTQLNADPTETGRNFQRASSSAAAGLDRALKTATTTIQDATIGPVLTQLDTIKHHIKTVRTACRTHKHGTDALFTQGRMTSVQHILNVENTTRNLTITVDMIWDPEWVKRTISMDTIRLEVQRRAQLIADLIANDPRCDEAIAAENCARTNWNHIPETITSPITLTVTLNAWDLDQLLTAITNTGLDVDITQPVDTAV